MVQFHKCTIAFNHNTKRKKNSRINLLKAVNLEIVAVAGENLFTGYS